MSSNSPIYSCQGGSTPLINNTAPYCIVPGGNKRMEICCIESGQGVVEFEPDCYSWCLVYVNAGRDLDFQDALQKATDKFGWCLSHGVNASSPTGMVCNKGTNLTSPDDSATMTSTSVRGMPATSSERAAAMQTGSAKSAGALALLLAAGALGGVVV